MQLNRARVPGWYQYRRLRLRDIWWQRIRQYHILTYKNEQMFSETVAQSCLFKGCDLTRIYTTEKDTFFFTANIWHLISNDTILIKQQTYFNLEMHENAAYEDMYAISICMAVKIHSRKIISACHHLICAATANTGSVGGRRSTQMSFFRKWSHAVSEKYPCTTWLILTIMPLDGLFASLKLFNENPLRFCL